MSTETIQEITIDEKIKREIEFPKKYKVILLNDNHTPIDFVILLLVEIFKHSKDTAEKLTLTIHNEGSGIAGIYSYEVAESKQVEAITMSRNHGFPLNIKIEQE